MVHAIITGVYPVPSSRKASEKIVTLIPKDVTGQIVDLGSGWGNLAFPLAKAFPSSTVIGYELSPIPWLFSKARGFLFPRNNLSLQRKNFFNVSLREAGVVACYLHPEKMNELRPKFEEELQRGTLVFSNAFSIPSWTPQEVHHLSDLLSTTIHVYKV